jgi:CheY-like chemotaxis protein
MNPELPRILLAEDSINDRDLAIAALAESGLANEVVWLADGQAVLDYLLREGEHAARPEGQPAVLLLDLKMPKVDGLQVLERIKSDPGLRTLPVVMLTSSREERDVVKSYGLGVNAYVVKPVDFPEFVAALRDVGVFWAVLNQPPPARREGGAPPAGGGAGWP